MPQTVPWTRKDLDRLPDDGNTYEVLDGELLVTPAPSDEHQEVVAWLTEKLLPFVVEHRLGRIHHPRAVVVIEGSQLEPDLMVRPIAPLRGWEKAPLPILVVEVLSGATRRRDLGKKRDFYMKKGIPEYWAVDRRSSSVMQCLPGKEELITGVLTWSPRGTAVALDIDVAALFAETQTAL